ncbi:DEAD/DEAH box helicase [Erythrobacter crassostreae]|uniref:DEAD/DEAH box helicase n=1 Tax=Erythrobacter crassostreae TaxID=2828328 RepID=A0A9X1JMF2_9SPHN|nr:DEAD/DEAH box helicase [Erythrobacter crassostrea]MBV7259359.1 DEAD/DEAH box helicase [Erythrobacter crassostrea]
MKSADKNYAGSSPGARLEDVLVKFTTGDLVNIIGDEVLSLADAAISADKDRLVDVAAQRLRSDIELFEFGKAGRLLTRNLSSEKRDELQQRIDGAEGSVQTGSSSHRSLVAQFFGVSQSAETIDIAPPHVSTVSADYALFEHQRSVVRRTQAKIGGGNGRTVIHMPTGAGKTRTAMHYACSELNRSENGVIIWLASGKELLDQATEAFTTAWSHLGNRSVELVRFWGNHSPDPSLIEDGIIVAGLQKMHHWHRSDPIRALRLGVKSRLVIVDEAHQAIAATYRTVIEGLTEAGQHNALLGLTATPGRTWSDVSHDQELADFFSGSKVALEIPPYDNPVEYLLKDGYLARPTFHTLRYVDDADEHTIPSMVGSNDYDAAEIDHISASRPRNLAILKAVADLIAKGHTRILVFAASVEHAKLISAVLSLEGTESSSVTAETPDGSRRALLRRFKKRSSKPIVLCNFGVLTTGFDAPATSAAVIARPTKSLVLFSQMVGRATRGPKAGGNAESEIITVHDPNAPGFGDVAEAFFNWEDVWNE